MIENAIPADDAFAGKVVVVSLRSDAERGSILADVTVRRLGGMPSWLELRWALDARANGTPGG